MNYNEDSGLGWDVIIMASAFRLLEVYNNAQHSPQIFLRCVVLLQQAVSLFSCISVLRALLRCIVLPFSFRKNSIFVTTDDSQWFLKVWPYMSLQIFLFRIAPCDQNKMKISQMANAFKVVYGCSEDSCKIHAVTEGAYLHETREPIKRNHLLTCFLFLFVVNVSSGCR